MACIAGTGLPRSRRVVVALTHIYGTGESTAKKICRGAGISEGIRTNDSTPEDQGKLRNEVNKYRVKGDLRREISLNIKRLVEIGSYCGIHRHRRLPVHGQDTKNNVRIRKGSKRKQFIK